jgi:hypothetical protein
MTSLIKITLLGCCRQESLYNDPKYQIPYYKNELDISDLFIIEIASKTAYEFNNVYRHNIVVKPEHNEKVSCKDNIIIRKQSYEEIENDILEIKRELGNKKIMIV